MKNIIAPLLLLIAAPTFAADVVTATITVTNTASDGDTITVNGTARTFYDSVTNAPVEISTSTNGVAGTRTNLYTHLGAYRPTGLTVGQSSTNVVTLRTAPGGTLTVETAGDWAEVAYSTNTLTPAYAVRVPISVESSEQKTNIVSALVSALAGGESTNAFFESSPAVANLVGLTNAQTISGAKSLTNHDNSIAGYIFGVGETAWFRNPTNNTMTLYLAGGDLGGVTNYIQCTPAGLILSAGSGNIYTSGGLYLAGDMYLSSHTISSDYFSISTNGIVGSGLNITNLNGTNITSGTITGSKLVESGIGLSGTNHINGDLSITRYAITTLADGNNAAIAVGTNTFIEVSGPTSAFTINGIAGGRDGKLVIILNQTGQNMTIAHDSGVDPAAANRIYSMSGADRSTTANGSATLIYNANSSRWILLSLDP